MFRSLLPLSFRSGDVGSNGSSGNNILRPMGPAMTAGLRNGSIGNATIAAGPPNAAAGIAYNGMTTTAAVAPVTTFPFLRYGLNLERK